jgi:pilus assembly protein CpaC
MQTLRPSLRAAALLLGATVWQCAGSWTYAQQPPQVRSQPLVRELTPFGTKGASPSTEPLRIAMQPDDGPIEVPRLPMLQPPIQPPNGFPAPPATAPRIPSRFEVLPPAQPGLSTPRPSPDTIRQYGRFVESTIDPEMTLELIVGRPRLLVFRDTPARIYIPDEAVAAYQVITPTEISVVGRTVGSTVLNVWVDDPTAPRGQRVLSYLLQVQDDPELRTHQERQIVDLEAEINRVFPTTRIQLSFVGDMLVVRGEAKDAIEAAQVLQVVARHSLALRRHVTPEGEEVAIAQTMLNYVDRDPTLDADAAALRNSVLNVGMLRRANIVNLITVPGEQQVMLRVTVAEINRTAARSIGLNFSVANNQGMTVFQSLSGNIAGAASGAAQSGQANLPIALDNGQVQLAVNALRQLRFARTLAEPNLVTLNGRTATFAAGGRFPVPVVAGFTNAGLQGVAFVPFGVQLQFTPFIVDRDRIRLNVNAEVSTRDEALGTNVGGAASAGGTNVAGLNTRNFDTTVELREGQTLAVAGLIQNNFGGSSDRVPFWGDLPWVGWTGGFNRSSSGEQELVVLITPELVHPLDACDTPPLPGADVFEPSDVEFYLANRLESRRGVDYRASVRTDYHRIRGGDKFCRDPFLIGPNGQTYGCCPPLVCPP